MSQRRASVFAAVASLLIAGASAHGAGAWRDPHHYVDDTSLAGLRFVAEDPPHTLIMVGTDDGKQWWTLQGTCSGEGMTVIRFDFSPKGGPADVEGTWARNRDDQTTITWPDGNVWQLLEEPTEAWSFPTQLDDHFGLFTDPHHYQSATSFAGTRYLADAYPPGSGKLVLVGSDDGSSWWTARGTIVDDVHLAVDFSAKGGPADLTATWASAAEQPSVDPRPLMLGGKSLPGQLVWPDGNAWSKNGGVAASSVVGGAPEAAAAAAAAIAHQKQQLQQAVSSSPAGDAEADATRGRNPTSSPRKACSSWNATQAAAHERAFERCVAPEMTAENNAYVRSALLLNGSAPLSEMANLLLMSYPQEVCSCTLYLENAASCSQTSSAHVVLGVYQPWCFLLAACSTMAKMLLRAAFLCHAAGMTGDNTSALCVDDGANACAVATQNLFDAMHTDDGWTNSSELLHALRVPLAAVKGALKDPWANGGLSSTIKETLRAAKVAVLRKRQWFGQLSMCMATVGVDEASLNLPMAISVLSGNGSFTQYDQLFEAKCQVLLPLPPLSPLPPLPPLPPVLPSLFPLLSPLLSPLSSLISPRSLSGAVCVLARGVGERARELLQRLRLRDGRARDGHVHGRGDRDRHRRRQRRRALRAVPRRRRLRQARLLLPDVQPVDRLGARRAARHRHRDDGRRRRRRRERPPRRRRHHRVRGAGGAARVGTVGSIRSLVR